MIQLLVYLWPYACGTLYWGWKIPEQDQNFIRQWKETDESITAQVKTELDKQGSAFTVTFGDKNYLTNNGQDLPFVVDWEKKTITEKGSDGVLTFEIEDGKLLLDSGETGVVFIMTKQ